MSYPATPTLSVDRSQASETLDEVTPVTRGLAGLLGGVVSAGPGVTRSSRVPCFGMLAPHLPLKLPSSLRVHRSRTLALPEKPRSVQLAVTVARFAPRLNSATVYELSVFLTHQTCCSPPARSGLAGLPC